jgi:predicted MPP superfamily phosphohydrolase
LVARRESLIGMSRLFDLDMLVGLAAAIVGHFATAVWLFNRLHAIAIPRRVIKFLEKVLIAVAASVLAVFLIRSLLFHDALFSALSDSPTLWQSVLSCYVASCWLVALLSVPCWLVPKLRERPPAALLSNDTTMVDVVQRLGYRPVHGREAVFLAGIPGNQLLTFAVQRKTLRLPTLPPELDGLTIAHLSDLHMTGKVGREYYDAIVDETNALEPDLICITGDIVEKERCLPWIEPTLGRLRARHGKFFVLGNHEKRLTDIAGLRALLSQAGLTDLGNRFLFVTILGMDIMLAGNELPWFGTAPATPHSALCNPHFRILLTHTPDQLPWARSHQFDLMLAGHNHGGQIRLPYLGALITPSKHGFRYAGGLYDEPPTLLHVSRGLGGIHPIRLNCPPELALLLLNREHKPEA